MDGQGHFTLCLLLGGSSFVVGNATTQHSTRWWCIIMKQRVLAQALNDLCMLILLQTEVFCQTSIRYILTLLSSAFVDTRHFIWLLFSLSNVQNWSIFRVTGVSTTTCLPHLWTRWWRVRIPLRWTFSWLKFLKVKDLGHFLNEKGEVRFFGRKEALESFGELSGQFFSVLGILPGPCTLHSHIQ